MPAKPLWFGRLPDAISQLEQTADPWVDRPTLESLLGIGRRRAQQLLAPIAQRVGTSSVASRSALIAYLQRIAAREEAYYETRRQQQFWGKLSRTRQEWIAHPPVLIEMSNAQVRHVEVHDFEGLPEGVELAPGSILVRFSDPEEALRKLMALAMAISQNQQAFEERVRLPRV
jgi:hypothetical protein